MSVVKGTALPQAKLTERVIPVLRELYDAGCDDALAEVRAALGVEQ